MSTGLAIDSWKLALLNQFMLVVCYNNPQIWLVPNANKMTYFLIMCNVSLHSSLTLITYHIFFLKNNTWKSMKPSKMWVLKSWPFCITKTKLQSELIDRLPNSMELFPSFNRTSPLRKGAL